MLPVSVKRLILFLLKKLVPRISRRVTFNSLKRNYTEKELYLLRFLCNAEMTSLDIGAAKGLFIVHLLDLSKNCIAFEARPDQAIELKKMLAFTPKASVEAVGLSDKNGEATIKIPAKDQGRSTIEEDNLLEDSDGGERRDVKITIRKLDDYDLKQVGFMKIDVEGHELAVLQGAKQTIQKSFPMLLIEIEERHKKGSVENVTLFLKDLSYSGFFLLNGKVTSLEKFDYAIHQNVRNAGTLQNNYQKKGLYINNFVFVPRIRLQQFIEDTQSLLIG